MTSVAAAFVGCKVSQADGEAALRELAAAGLEIAGSRDAADVVVVHTCCVTAEAERKSRRLVRRAAADGRRVVVAGCAADWPSGPACAFAAPAPASAVVVSIVASAARRVDPFLYP